jgi:hypothetical protein
VPHAYVPIRVENSLGSQDPVRHNEALNQARAGGSRRRFGRLQRWEVCPDAGQTRRAQGCSRSNAQEYTLGQGAQHWRFLVAFSGVLVSKKRLFMHK